MLYLLTENILSQLNRLIQMKNAIEIYKSLDGVEVSVVIENETVWATQRQMAEIFGTTQQNITLHLNKVYREGEIIKDSTCKEYLQVQTEGRRTEEDCLTL